MNQKKSLVYLNSDEVGELQNTKDGLQFKYNDNWQKSGFAISHSLPLNDKIYTQPAKTFFSNLLPEGNLRELVCRSLKISPENDWDLLLRIGRESAGALTISQEGPPDPDSFEYELLSAKEINKLSQEKSVLPMLIRQTATRLSLAGAQDKLAVYFDGEQYWLPINGAPTNYIFKFDNSDYSQLPANEVFLIQLAGSIGLTVVESDLYLKGKKPIATFKRYDRQENKTLYRIHQEDFCQALAISQKNKYEKEGGTSFNQVLSFVATHDYQPVKTRLNLIRWYLFNLICGNSDAHGKNISLFVSSKKSELTPFYDLVCTRIYKKIDRHLAMSFAKNFDPDQFNAKTLVDWSNEINVNKTFLLSETKALLNQLEENLPKQVKAFKEKYGHHGIIEQISLFIHKRIKKCNSL